MPDSGLIQELGTPSPAEGGGTAEIDSLKGRALRSVLWVALEKWGSRLSTLIVFAVLGRLLDPADLGLAAFAATFVTLFTMLADQGFSSALVQRETLDAAHSDTAFWTSFVSSILMMAATIALAPVLGSAFSQPRLTLVIQLLSITLPLGALEATPAALLEREFQFSRLTARKLTSTVIGSIAGIVVALLGGGVWSLVVQAIVQSAVGVAVLWTVSAWRPKFSYSKRSSADLRKVGFSALGIDVLGFVNAYVDKLLIGAILGPVSLGYYYVGSRVISLITDVQTSVIEAVSLTTLSRLQSHRERFRSAYYRLIGTSSALSVFTFAILAVCAHEVVVDVFGRQWASSVPIMQVLCLMGALNAVLIFDRSALLSVGRARLAFSITTTQAVLNVIAVLASAHLGILAVAIAITVRQYLIWPLRMRALRSALSISLKAYARQLLAPVVAVIPVVTVTYYLNSILEPFRGGPFISPVACGLVGLGIYLPMLYLVNRPLLAELWSTVRRQGDVSASDLLGSEES